jgi:hypothetical protein
MVFVGICCQEHGEIYQIIVAYPAGCLSGFIEDIHPSSSTTTRAFPSIHVKQTDGAHGQHNCSGFNPERFFSFFHDSSPFWFMSRLAMAGFMYPGTCPFAYFSGLNGMPTVDRQYPQPNAVR